MNTASSVRHAHRVLGLDFTGRKHKRSPARDSASALSPVQLRQLVASMVD